LVFAISLLALLILALSDGRILSQWPLADTFVAAWSPDGKNLICYRSYQAFLMSIDGIKSRAIQIPTSGFITPERVAYMSAIDALVWMQNGFSDPADPPHSHKSSPSLQIGDLSDPNRQTPFPTCQFGRKQSHSRQG